MLGKIAVLLDNVCASIILLSFLDPSSKYHSERGFSEPSAKQVEYADIRCFSRTYCVASKNDWAFFNEFCSSFRWRMTAMTRVWRSLFEITTLRRRYETSAAKSLTPPATTTLCDRIHLPLTTVVAAKCLYKCFYLYFQTLTIFVRPVDSPSFREFTPAHIEKLKVAMSNRYAPPTQSLDLSDFQNDTGQWH